MSMEKRSPEATVPVCDVDTSSDAYYGLKRLTSYSGIGLRRLRSYLTDRAHPLPHYRVGGKILVRRSEFDRWIEVYRRAETSRVDDIVADLLGGSR
jgi:hypothetical protein